MAESSRTPKAKNVKVQQNDAAVQDSAASSHSTYVIIDAWLLEAFLTPTHCNLPNTGL